MADAVVRVGVVVIFYLMSQELEKRETRKKKIILLRNWIGRTKLNILHPTKIF